MSPVTPAATATLETAGTGKTWFKVWQDPPTWTKAGGFLWPSESMTQFGFTIPKTLPSGQYLVRFEQIALHVASTYAGAQGVLSCPSNRPLGVVCVLILIYWTFLSLLVRNDVQPCPEILVLTRFPHTIS